MSNRMCRVTVGNETKTYPEGTCYGEIVKDFSSHSRVSGGVGDGGGKTERTA